jgi:hypothetical protein
MIRTVWKARMNIAAEFPADYDGRTHHLEPGHAKFEPPERFTDSTDEQPDADDGKKQSNGGHGFLCDGLGDEV